MLRSLLVAVVLLSARIASAYDPCDFSADVAMTIEQVRDCYESVPFCPDPTNAAMCDRDAQVAYFREAIEQGSDLADYFDARVHWRSRLDAIANTQFANDFEQFQAFGALFNSFANDHWFYNGPSCFEFGTYELVPITFGSAMVRGEQIIYLRDVFSEGAGSFDLSPYGPLYEEFSGIDVTAFTGERVVSIQGQEPLRFFRRWGRTFATDDSDGVNLMAILDEAAYTLRSGSFNPFPESPTIELVLERANGRRHRVSLPWMAFPWEFLPSSTEEFRAICYAPNVPALAAADELSAEPGDRMLRSPRYERRRLLQGFAGHARHHGHGNRGGRGEAPGEVGPPVTEVYPASNGARTVALGDTVAIQLRTGFIQDWRAEVIEGGAYACEHADRLIIDLRGNGGGYLSRIEWLLAYLNPGASFPANRIPFRQLARSPMLDELRELSLPLAGLGYDPCTTGYEAACYVTPDGEALEADYYNDVEFERRGGRRVPLTPMVVQSPRAVDSIPCPGKFLGKKLIILVNGLNASAGYFSAEKLAELGTLVLMGGFQGEEMNIGRARGGSVNHIYDWTGIADYLEAALGVSAVHRLPDPPRFVDLTIENTALYRPNQRTLYIDKQTKPHARINFWSNTYDTDGAAYTAAIQAVRRLDRWWWPF